MANTFLTPDIIADAAIATLYENAVMAGLVNRDYDGEFAQNVGDTITIRKPATFAANDFVRATGITIQDATEQSTTLTLDKFKDVSIAVTAEQLSLELDDFAERLLNPAMEAIWQQIDVDLLSLRGDVTAETGQAGVNGIYDQDNARAVIDAGRVLNEAKVPMSMRRVVTGPQQMAAWLGDTLISTADQSGTTLGLREASIGRLFGMDTYMDQHIDVPAQTSGNSTTEVGVAFHRDAFTIAFRPLVVPAGAQNAVVRNYKGFGLRVVMDYDITKKQDVVSIDCLYGVKTLDASKAVLIKGVDVP